MLCKTDPCVYASSKPVFQLSLWSPILKLKLNNQDVISVKLYSKRFIVITEFSKITSNQIKNLVDCRSRPGVGNLKNLKSYLVPKKTKHWEPQNSFDV